jgi:hypothetical protein
VVTPGVRAWWETVGRAFEDPRWDELDIRGSGDSGVVKLRITATLAGAEVAQIVWLAAKLRAGKLRWWGFFRAEHEALEAVGLRD